MTKEEIIFIKAGNKIEDFLKFKSELDKCNGLDFTTELNLSQIFQCMDEYVIKVLEGILGQGILTGLESEIRKQITEIKALMK